MKVASLLFAIALAGASTVSSGQTKSTTEDADINLMGDTFKFNAKVERFTPSDSAAGATPVTAPRGSCFRISQELEKKDPADATKTIKFVRGTFRTGWRGLYSCSDRSELVGVDPDLSYDVPRQTILEDRDTTRFGWTYGILVAPFKYYWSEQSFSTGAAVGPYLGYRLYDRPGNSTVLAGAVGASTATVKTENADGTTTSSQKNGLTFALAYLFNIKRDFNVGFIGGWDVFSKSDDVPTSGKLWLSLSFGRKID